MPEITLETIDLLLENLANDCKETIANEEKYIGIVITDINGELATHSEHYYVVSHLWARANFLVKKVKQYEKEQKGKKSLIIRKDPKKAGIVKMSEGALDNLLCSDVELLAIGDCVFEAEKLLDKVEALKNAFEHRRSMLNNITDLIMNKVIDAGETPVKEYATSLKRR